MFLTMQTAFVTSIILDLLSRTGAYDNTALNEDSAILGVLDSLQLVSFLLDVEAALETHAQVQVNLTTDLFENREGPLTSVKPFVQYLDSLAKQTQMQ